jgi:hypothetical protein
MEKRIRVKTFVVITDNNTQCGGVSCGHALRAYNTEMDMSGQKRAKLVILSLTTNNFTITEDGNPDILDVVGFDLDSHKRIFDFIRGDVAMPA